MLKLAAVMAVTLAVAGICGSGEPEIPFPESTPFPPEFAERLHSVRDQASELRRLPINRNVVEGTVPREALRTYYDDVSASLDEDERRELEVFNIAWRIMHMIGPDTDILDTALEMESEGILGFYVPDENELVLVGDTAEFSDDDEWVIAHEYVHSFQYQLFDPKRLGKYVEKEKDDSPTEYGTTIDCVKEGDATLAGIRFAQEKFGPDYFDRLGEDSPPEAEETHAGDSPALERYDAFNYSECPRFVMAIQSDGGWDAVDKLYKDPPSTTEQILHPEKYRKREKATGLRPINLEDRLGDGWKRLDSSIMGEFDVYNYLATVLDDEFSAALAAEGWGVGWISTYAYGTDDTDIDIKSQKVLVHIALEWDSLQDLGEFAFVYGALIGKLTSDYTVDEEKGPLCWKGDPEYGYIGWDENSRRIDIVITNDESARDAATSDFLSGQVRRPCPEPEE